MRRIGIEIGAPRLGAAIVLGAGALYAGVYGVRAAVGREAAPSCPAPPVAGEDIAAVFGRPHDYTETARLVRAARRYGFRDARYRLDPCGRLEVVVAKLPDLKTARDVAKEAHSVGLHVTLERDA